MCVKRPCACGTLCSPCGGNTVSSLESAEIEADFLGCIHLTGPGISQLSVWCIRFGEGWVFGRGMVWLMESCHKSDEQTDG